MGEASGDDDALALLEQIWQNTLVGHRDALSGIRHHELHGDAIRLPLNTALLHHTADAKRPLGRHFVGRHLRGRKEKHQILVERLQHQHHGDAQARDTRHD